MHGMRHRAQLGAQAAQRLGRDLAGELRRNSLVGRRFDDGENVGRPPALKRRRITVSAESAMPMRLNASASTAAAIGSLSTSTPLQSKMTNGPSDPRSGSPAAVQLFEGSDDEEHIAGCGDAKSACGLTDHYAQKSIRAVDDVQPS